MRLLFFIYTACAAGLVLRGRKKNIIQRLRSIFQNDNMLDDGYVLGTSQNSSLEEMFAHIPKMITQRATSSNIGCRNGGTYVKDTFIPCRVTLTGKQAPLCWNSKQGNLFGLKNSVGLDLDFGCCYPNETRLLSQVQTFFPEVWSYFDPKVSARINWVQRSDIFRYVNMYKFGGIYADEDTCPLQHVDDWVQLWSLEKSKVHAIFGFEKLDGTQSCGIPFVPMQFVQAAFASAPRSPIIFHILQQVHQQILLGQPDVLASTGPRIFSRAILDFIGKYGEIPGFRADGVPKSLIDAVVDGRSNIVRCNFHGELINILILGQDAFNSKPYQNTFTGERLVRHDNLGSWKSESWCDCTVNSNCYPEWTKHHPITSNYSNDIS